MSRRRLAALLALAAAAGVGLGVAARPRGSGPSRPDEVEAALAAVDRDDTTGLARAVDAAGDPSRFARPWRDELAFARMVSAGDHDALWRFATDGERDAARARALLYLVERGRALPDRERALARLRQDYPDSWAVNRPRAKDAGR